MSQTIARILRSKASDEEAHGYKLWLLSVGKSVAETAKERGFLIFGGAQVSDGEMEALTEVASALGLHK